MHLVREEELDPRAQDYLRTHIERHGGPGYRTHFATDDPTLGVRLLEGLRAREDEGGVEAHDDDTGRRLGAPPVGIDVGPAGDPLELRHRRTRRSEDHQDEGHHHRDQQTR